MCGALSDGLWDGLARPMGVEDATGFVRPVVGNNQDGLARQVQGCDARLQWTNVMYGFVMRQFADLVGKCVKTDKEFIDLHPSVVARDVSKFTNHEITGTQVYNHLHKWH